MKLTYSDSGDSFVLSSHHLDPQHGYEVGDTGTVEIQGTSGSFEMTEEGLAIQMDEIVAFICGTCIDLEIDEDSGCNGDTGNACETEKVELTPETKLAVLDENNCPTGHVTFQDILDYLSEEETSPCSAGELTEVTTTTMIMGVVRSGDSCEQVLINPSAFKCDPEVSDFDCE